MNVAFVVVSSSSSVGIFFDIGSNSSRAIKSFSELTLSINDIWVLFWYSIFYMSEATRNNKKPPFARFAIVASSGGTDIIIRLRRRFCKKRSILVPKLPKITVRWRLYSISKWKVFWTGRCVYQNHFKNWRSKSANSECNESLKFFADKVMEYLIYNALLHNVVVINTSSRNDIRYSIMLSL